MCTDLRFSNGIDQAFQLLYPHTVYSLVERVQRRPIPKARVEVFVLSNSSLCYDKDGNVIKEHPDRIDPHLLLKKRSLW